MSDVSNFHNTSEAIRIQRLIESYEEESQIAYEEFCDAENKLEDLRIEYNALEDAYEN